MRTLTSKRGQEEVVSIRRSESADAQGIHRLVGPSALAVFGRVNVIHLLEKANLAVTLANGKEEILAHASFFDHPMGDVVDQTRWELFLQGDFNAKACTPLNTLFLHLFVAKPDFAAASAKEIMRAVFNAVAELEHVCLVGPNNGALEPALDELFRPLRPQTDGGPRRSALVCHRGEHCPKLHVRQARLEDHDDIMHILEEQAKHLPAFTQPSFLSELLEAQNEKSHAGVCEIGGVAIGLVSVTRCVDLKRLNELFDLSVLDGLSRPAAPSPAPQPLSPSPQPLSPSPQPVSPAPQPLSPALQPLSPSPQPVSPAPQPLSPAPQPVSPSTQPLSPAPQPVSPVPPSLSPAPQPLSPVPQPVSPAPQPLSPAPQPDSNIAGIQCFVIDKDYETRSVDVISYVFNHFPDLDFCIISVPTTCPEFPLLQSFIRVPPRTSISPARDLYVLHRAGLSGVEVRPAAPADRPAISDLVADLKLGESLLQDLDRYHETRRDTDGVPLQAFVAQLLGQVVGVLILRDEQDVGYIRARYNVESFVYFSHHAAEEHAQVLHLVLHKRCSRCSRCSRHFFKEALRLSRRTCLFLRSYSHAHQETSCVPHLDFVLDCSVPVRPRRQIVFPLEELGINAPARQITQEQAPFALSLISRKLTLEPKVTVNARIVVVGASDTGLSFLEVLCLCPHLRFNYLTLVSTHGFPGDHEDDGFLSTSHAYSSADLARLPLHAGVTVVTGKMVGIHRKSKRIRVSGGAKVPYDHLVLCTGLQYQVPRPAGVDLNPSGTNKSRYSGPVPSNLFTLNDLHDCAAARRWLLANFVELEDAAVVYGSGLDVFTAAEALLGLGVRGDRVHLVLTPPEPGGASGLGDPVVEKAVAVALAEAEVRVHRGRLLALMNDGGHPEPLASVTFSSDAEEPLLRLPCGVFINLSNRGVDSDAFRSISGSFLVFDGRLVIDATFHTCDSSISAAGPLTKLSRCYYADEWSHGNFNAKEVGRELAAMLLPLFDPTLQVAVEPPPEPNRLLPHYKQPKIQGGTLPGGLHYLHLTKPPSGNPAVAQQVQDGDGVGVGMVTGRAETGNYFHLRLDAFELVETLTCLSPKLLPLPVHNYLSLYGRHQQLLGQLSSRYQQGLVHDLHSFFRQSWCLAVFHDRFSDFEEELQQNSDTELGSLRSSAVRYLTYNRNLLPMFALPGQL
ncbi:cilia- and flagella-associated protein 61 [Clinocottus analis]|uniref:cilia- and flagella-associated protein 61 n=1 Tax=Clinocottus analis TaxID=304258 RepID=UPI0035BF6667